MMILNNNPAPTTMYEVTLVNQFIPQRLSAVYRYTLPANSDPSSLTMPLVWNLAVRKSRLQFWQPAQAIQLINESTARRQWDESQTLSYLELGELLQQALQANSNTVALSWQQLWERRFRIQSQQLLADQTDALPVDSTTEAKQRQLLTDLRKFQGTAFESSSLRLSASDVWRVYGISQTAAVYQDAYGSFAKATLSQPALPPRDWRRLAMLLAAGLLSATMLALVAARTGWGNWPGHHPTASLLLASLLWLIYLQPREFAVLLAVLAVLTWAMKRREARNLDPTDFELVAAK